MAVYTDVSAEDLGAFLAGYDLGELLSYKGIAEGVENSNFLVHTGTRPLHPDALREARGGRRRAVLPGADGASGVARHHLPAAGEESQRRGARQAVRPAGRDRHLPRRHVDAAAGRRAIAPRSARRWRACIWPAPISAASARNALSVGGWRPLFEQAAERADSVQHGMRATIEKELAHLEKAWPRDLPQGVIHADLFPDNVFFLGDKLSGLIDFYFACTDTLAYDVAICLNAWCFEPDHSYNVTKGRNLLTSYIKTRPLSEAELDALPLLARGAAMRFLLTRLVDWLNVPTGALVQPKNPLEYFRKLRFHQKAASVRDYGLPDEGARA